MTLALISVINLLLDILWWVIIAQVVLSWLLVFNVINTNSQGVRNFIRALDRLLDPIYRPIRRLLPDFGGIDFSPMIVLILIMVIQRLLAGVATEVAYPA